MQSKECICNYSGTEGRCSWAKRGRRFGCMNWMQIMSWWYFVDVHRTDKRYVLYWRSRYTGKGSATIWGKPGSQWVDDCHRWAAKFWTVSVNALMAVNNWKCLTVWSTKVNLKNLSTSNPYLKENAFPCQWSIDFMLFKEIIAVCCMRIHFVGKIQTQWMLQQVVHMVNHKLLNL